MLKQHLIGAGVFKRISGAAQLAAAAERGQFREDAYLTPMEASLSGNELVNATAQKMTETVAILFWTRVAGDATGDAALDAIEEKREEIAAALLGWEPDAGHAPMTYAGGRLMQFAPGGGALWADSWRTESYLRAAA